MEMNNFLDNYFHGLSDKTVHRGALALLIACGVAIVAINSRDNISKNRYDRMLKTALWKLTTGSTDAEQRSMYRSGWWKLLIAGAMLAALFVTVALRPLGRDRTMTIAGIFLMLWVAGLQLAWYFYFLPLLTKKGTTRNSGQSGKRSDVGWLSRERRDKTDGDDSESPGDPRLPITIITGFLGSGKTTLVKNILTNTIGMKILVIENEIGTEGIDHDLLLQDAGKEEIILMNNGCVCCTVRKDLLKTFHRLFADDAFAALQWVVIETTGLADPAPLIQSLYMDDQCKWKLRMDAVLTVVDCKHFPLHVAQHRMGQQGVHGGVPEAVQQIAYADRILLNKTDLVTSEELDKVCEAVVEINPTGQVITCQRSSVPLEEILNIRAFDGTRNRAMLNTMGGGVFSIQTDKNGRIAKKVVRYGICGEGQKKKAVTRGLAGSSSSNNLVDSSENTEETLAEMLGELRAEGALNVPMGLVKSKSSSDVSADLVTGSYSSPEKKGDVVNAGVADRGRVVTISLVEAEPLDLDKLDYFLAELLKQHGADLYRLKGILSVHGFDQQFVAHGVHMVFDGELGPKWPESGKRQSRLVLIGTNLDRRKLETDFKCCVYSQ